MKKIAVLIVDDNEDDRYLLKRELSKTNLNIEVFEESDGEDALTFFEKNNTMREKYPGIYPPLVIFLDINMPIVDGFSFLEAFTVLREKLNLYSSVVMMFSSSARPSDVEKALSYDFVSDYLTKGAFDIDALASKIKTLAV